MRVIIVDDEAHARSVVLEYLQGHPDVAVVAECVNGFEAVKAIAELEPDLVFLDIQMPKLDGFEVAGLASGKCRIIFVTAFDQYAIKAFEVHAIDYLLKPFSQLRFDDALKHARDSLGGQASIDELISDVAIRNLPLERILIRDGAKVHVIAAAKIDYIAAQDDYIQISSEGKSYLKNQRLSSVETQLDAKQFVRVHRSFIVNIERIGRIEQYAKDSHAAILSDGTRIPLSRRGYQGIKSLM